MEIKGRMKCFLVAGLSLWSLLAMASPPQWQIIPKESQLTFTASQNGSPVSGEFKVFNGAIFVDPQDLKNSSIDITVDINSVNTSYSELKNTLITSDWFNAKVFPKAEFKSKQIEKTGDNQYNAKGTLTIRDKSVPVTLNFSAEYNESKGSVVGSTVIKRSDFGVGQGEWAGTDEIKDDVTVSFKVAAIKK